MSSRQGAGAIISLVSLVMFVLISQLVTVGAAPIAVRASSHSNSTSSGIDLSIWELQLPTGEPGHPDTISTGKLRTFTKSNVYTESDGALVMVVPGSPESGCVTTANSKHCRTEFREVEPKSWSPSGTNKMNATLLVKAAGGNTVIGQIHLADDVSTKPVCELYYKDNGDISIGVERTKEGGNQVLIDLGNVPLGTKFSYEIDYSDNKLKVTINDKTHTLNTFDVGGLDSYFKAGNYNQGSKRSEVHFYSLNVQH